MGKFRADFVVRADLVLPHDVSRHELHRATENTPAEYTVTLANAPVDSRGHVPHLVAEVIGTCADFNAATTEFREALARMLDVISLVTRCKFQIERCWRVIEWEPFKAERVMWLIHQEDAHDPPAPNLVVPFLTTAALLFQKLAEQPMLTRPVQAYRQGLLATQQQDQFQNFWGALESLATAKQAGATVNITCPTCQDQVYCNRCEAHPVRPKMPTEEMKSILGGLSSQGEAIFKKLSKVRNHLAHGRSPFTVEEKTGISLTDAVNRMAQGAWRAIMTHVEPFEGAAIGPEVNVLHHFRVMSVDITFPVRDGVEHPSNDQIPAPTISLITKFGDPKAPGGKGA